MKKPIIAGVSEILLEPHGDEQGMLVALEERKNIDFEIKRIYYIYNTVGCVTRGRHAHKDMKQVLLPVKGTCQILVDNGKESKKVVLDTPNRGIYITGLVWREMMNFSKDCVLLCLVNTYYDTGDYIRKYDEFLAEVKK